MGRPRKVSTVSTEGGDMSPQVASDWRPEEEGERSTKAHPFYPYSPGAPHYYPAGLSSPHTNKTSPAVVTCSPALGSDGPPVTTRQEELWLPRVCQGGPEGQTRSAFTRIGPGVRVSHSRELPPVCAAYDLALPGPSRMFSEFPRCPESSSVMHFGQKRYDWHMSRGRQRWEIPVLEQKRALPSPYERLGSESGGESPSSTHKVVDFPYREEFHKSREKHVFHSTWSSGVPGKTESPSRNEEYAGITALVEDKYRPPKLELMSSHETEWMETDSPEALNLSLSGEEENPKRCLPAASGEEGIAIDLSLKRESVQHADTLGTAPSTSQGYVGVTHAVKQETHRAGRRESFLRDYVDLESLQCLNALFSAIDFASNDTTENPTPEGTLQILSVPTAQTEPRESDASPPPPDRPRLTSSTTPCQLLRLGQVDPASRLEVLNKLLRSHGYDLVQVERYWRETSLVAPQARDVESRTRRLIQLQSSYFELLSAYEDEEPAKPKVASPRIDSHVHDRLARDSRQGIYFIFKVKDFSRFHSHDVTVMCKNGACFNVVLVMAAREWWDAGTGQFNRHFWTFPVAPDSPTLPFRQALLAVAARLHDLHMDRTETVLVMALLVACTAYINLADSQTIEEVRSDLLETLRHHIESRCENPDFRLRELLQVLPSVQHLGMWHSQLARHILVEVKEKC